ncbi:MAG: sigma-70 family RNA polymerase sigma factor [Bryobacterales bacterium]|nr:sigma-70 family RNA polymerase sigma factor [Acidobacteriota bacterium]MCB9383943.1 sigma-70 family RNA polymerase sigma factor [Bryobacterales bacterium]
MKITRWIAESFGGSVAAEGVVWLPAETAADAAEETARLFDDLRTPVLRYLLSMGLSPADGEDVVQEVFVALFQHLSRGRPRTNLRGWVFRTAHNLGLKARLRRRNTNGSAPEDVADGRPGAEEQLAANRRLAKIHAVAQALPQRDRSCLSLRAEGLTYREIAETLGISLGSVSIAIARSVAKIRESDR